MSYRYTEFGPRKLVRRDDGVFCHRKTLRPASWFARWTIGTAAWECNYIFHCQAAKMKRSVAERKKRNVCTVELLDEWLVTVYWA